jgi:superfamily I DNA and/or RNA helicase
VGATVYSCPSARKKTGLGKFDLVIVDEASQVRVAEAGVPAHLVAATGRLVLADDDMQLPPIVQGDYPEPEDGGPALHRSVFELVRRRVPEESPVVQKLTDNHRMNDVLTSFAAGLVYGPDYRCVNAAVASRRTRLRTQPESCPLLSACLDPAYPLVAVIMERTQASGENRAEAGLVAAMVAAVRDRLLDAGGGVYADNGEFFRRGVFVVSPHRAQNRAIRRELRFLRAWGSRPFVDTVDKMQGQEADVVIVSYGVADPEYALREAEFIYSLNRLNVAITRARTKSIVCIPAPLLQGSPAVLDVPEAAAGLAYMRTLIRELEAQDAGTVYPIPGGATARVVRAGSLLTS